MLRSRAERQGFRESPTRLFLAEYTADIERISSRFLDSRRFAASEFHIGSAVPAENIMLDWLSARTN
jgi:hypothetical protein